MSPKNNVMFRMISCLTVISACAVTSGSEAQLTVVEAQNRDGQHVNVIGPQTIVMSEVRDGKSQTLEIRIVDGKATVIRDGQELTDVQVIEDEDKVVIIDGNGNELHEFKMLGKGDGSGMYYFGNASVGGFDVTDHESLKRWMGNIGGAAPSVMLGVNMSVPGPALEKHLRLKPGATTMLSGVYEGLPAHQAGLGQFDIIVKVDGQSPADNDSIRKILSERKAGDTIALTVIQEGNQKDVTVTLQAYDAKSMAKAKLLGNGSENPFQFWIGEEGVPHAYRWGSEMPRVFFAPEKYNAEIEKLKPQVEKWREYGVTVAPKVQRDIEQQLQQLDERMADLETLLQKLIERRESNR